MNRTTNARLAGFAFLFYIATGVTTLALFNQATRAEGTAAKLARIVQHAPDVRGTVVLSLLMCAAALVLGVTLYRITPPGRLSRTLRQRTRLGRCWWRWA